MSQLTTLRVASGKILNFGEPVGMSITLLYVYDGGVPIMISERGKNMCVEGCVNIKSHRHICWQWKAQGDGRNLPPNSQQISLKKNQYMDMDILSQ